MSCSICQEEFDISIRIPIVGRCGHSVCRTCLIPESATSQFRPASECPLCRQRNAFWELRRNFQMIEVMESLSKKVQDLEEKEKLVPKGLIKCHICHTAIEEKRARICQLCCVEKNYIELGADNTVNTLEAEKVNESVMCADCFLEKPHEGHKSIFLLPIKLRSAAETEYSKLRREVKSISARCCDRTMKKLKVAMDSLDNPLEQLQLNAHSVDSTVAFTQGVDRCKALKSVLKSVEGELEGQVEQHLIRIKRVSKQLNDLATNDASVVNVTGEEAGALFESEALMARVLKDEKKEPTLCLGGESRVQVVNKSKSDYVHFRIKSSNASVSPDPGTIAPGSDVTLTIRHSWPIQKDPSFTIQYMTNKEALYPKYSHDLSVQLKK